MSESENDLGVARASENGAAMASENDRARGAVARHGGHLHSWVLAHRRGRVGNNADRIFGRIRHRPNGDDGS